MCKIHVFCCKIGFVAIYALLSQICFVAIYALLCGEKINQKLRVWRKNDKYEVWDLYAYGYMVHIDRMYPKTQILSKPNIEEEQIAGQSDSFSLEGSGSYMQMLLIYLTVSGRLHRARHISLYNTPTNPYLETYTNI